jgi:hypothetical protein
LELLHFSAWQLHLHQLSTLFGVFAFHRRSHPFNQVLLQQLIFPSLHAKRSSLVVFIKSTRDFLLYNFYIVSALSFIWELFFSLHLLSHYSTLLDPTGTPAQYLCALVQFLFSKFSLFLSYVWQQLILSQHLSKSK